MKEEVMKVMDRLLELINAENREQYKINAYFRW